MAMSQEYRELQEKYERLLFLVNTVPDLVSYVDSDYCYQFINRNYEKTLGQTSYDLSGKPLPVVLGDHEFTQLKPHFEQVLQGAEQELETRSSDPDHGQQYMRYKYVPHYSRENTIQGFAMLGQNISNTKLLENELENQAIFDELTGVANRRHFFELADREFSVAKRYENPLSIIYFDVDHLKDINAEHGEEAGDQVLQYISTLSVGLLREFDVLGRLGGQEFLICLPITNRNNACLVAERLRKFIEHESIPHKNGSFHITLSFGVSDIQQNDQELSEIVKRADEALFQSKCKGHNRVEAF
jgi:diguanylate cyclase (GGDEF)-like protein/PAS domain S-box-containing protein